MSEIIQHQDQYYILATSSLADDRTHVLKEGESFAIFNRSGDILPLGMHEQGLYHEGTRFLSHYELNFADNSRPLLLSSSVKDNNMLLAIDLTNPDCKIETKEFYHGTVHVLRRIFLWKKVCYEKIRFWNLGLEPLKTTFSMHVASDYKDIFEVRGVKRERRGAYLKRRYRDHELILSYRGLDNIVRKTWIHMEPAPARVADQELCFNLSLKPKEKVNFYFSIACGSKNKKPNVFPYYEAQSKAESVHFKRKQNYCYLTTSNEKFNHWVNQSMSDLQMMVTETPKGFYPYAGVPWFNTVFGRDGIITAFETLWINPEIAKGVLTYLAWTQAKKLSPKDDAEPGKILHETRTGEMANLKEVPFQKYYGSIDSTPLFLMLAGAYYERTGDRKLIESIWPNLELAGEWIDKFGDSDHDGFVEYLKHSPEGLIQQGWKDSDNSVFHADGTVPEGPNALCEVQGYVYAAKRALSRLASVLGKESWAAKLIHQSAELKKKFNQIYWNERLSTFGLALDGEKKLCEVRTSNAGQCLWTGIVDEDKAQKLAAALLREDFFSGWGIRTVSSLEIQYNPMSYHNGSVWPHDNALIAAGFAAYGLKKEAVKILTGLFDTSRFVELSRLPELCCGFEKRNGEGPTLYPVACSPQSWAAGSVFLALQACLGLSVNAVENTVYFNLPVLPPFLARVHILNLRVGSHTTSISIEKNDQDVAISVLNRTGNIKVITVK